MIFRQLFDNASSTYTYLIADRHTREAVLIDPVATNVSGGGTPGLISASAVRFNGSALLYLARGFETE